MPLTFRHASTQHGDELRLGHLTVLVGANNSGKSQTLRDLRDFAIAGNAQNLKLLRAVDCDMPTEADLRAHFTIRNPPENPGQETVSSVSASLVEVHNTASPRGWFDGLAAGNPGPGVLLQSLGRSLISHLHAETRFTLTAPQECFDLETEEPRNALHQYFRLRRTVQPALRSAFREAFDRDVALDYSSMRRWHFKVGRDFGILSDSLDELRGQLAAGELLTNQGDGYRSFVGIAMATLTFQDRPLLLDEPEAFLHPSQVRILGRWLAEHSVERSAQIVVATHSADFLWGVVNANPQASVLRLQRDGDRTRFVQVPATTTSGLAHSPLLSSQPILDALFHRGVVVCEGDADRALYQAVAHKSLVAERGEDFMFIHTNGKDAADTPIELLRSAGAPVCAVADIDVLSAEEPMAKIVMALTGEAISPDLEARRAQVAAWVEAMPSTEFLRALQDAVGAWLHGPHQNVREARRRLTGMAKVATSKWERVKRRGVNYFTGDELVAVSSLLQDLRSLGLFVVPCGELEGWMDNGGGKGKLWNRRALARIQADDCPVDLRTFVSEVLRHLSEPIR